MRGWQGSTRMRQVALLGILGKKVSTAFLVLQEIVCIKDDFAGNHEPT